MKNKSRSVKDYQSSLQNYALSLSADENFMGKIGLSEIALDLVLKLPLGMREKEFVKYVLEIGQNSHFYRQAA